MENKKVLNMEDRIIESMLGTAVNNIVVRRVKEGNLILKNDSIEVLDNNNNLHFVTYCPYDFEGENLNKVTRNKMNKAFIDRYTYKDIINIFEGIEEEKRNKVIKAENTRYILENLIDELLILEKYGTLEMLANHNTIEYYISFKRSYNINLEISLTEKENEFNVSYNYDRKIMNKEGLREIVKNIVDISENEIKEEAKRKEKEREEKNISNKRLEFARQIQQGKRAIIKLKSGYQCIERNKRYSVGDGKSGKFYKLNGIFGIVEYLEKKNINQYVFIDEADTYTLTNKKLKSLNYNNIA